MGASLPPPMHVEARRLFLIALVALAASVIGLLSVLRDDPAAQGLVDAPRATPAEAEAAPSYSELRTRQDPATLGLYELGMKQLRDALPALSDSVSQTPQDREVALARRASNRAFNGAPPTIPHTVEQLAEPNCLACHLTGLRIGGKVAPAISHQPYKSCLQCHVTQQAPETLSETPFLGNSFESTGFAQRGERAWPGAPPVVPHTSWMRSNCSSCHGVSGQLGMRATHPERQDCKQCHALSAGFDQRNFSAALSAHSMGSR